MSTLWSRRSLYVRLVLLVGLASYLIKTLTYDDSYVTCASRAWVRYLFYGLFYLFSLYNQGLFLLDICPTGIIFYFASFPLKVLETTIILNYFTLLNKLCIISPPWTDLLYYDSSPIQSPLRLLGPSNMLNLLHTSAFYRRIILMLKRKFQYSMTFSFNRLRMAINIKFFELVIILTYISFA